MQIRAERPEDVAAIAALTSAAFENAAHRSGSESAIIDALRRASALTVSLVAELDGQPVGHVAFSPIAVSGAVADWFGLGPLSVHPVYQRRGIGASLVKAGLHELALLGAGGCVVLGDPDYYSRFGFLANASLYYQNVPTQYFQSLVLRGAMPSGQVKYHPSFDVTETN